MASAVENPTIIEEYSQTFTSLQAGKRELIQCGAEAVMLNRFILDAAQATGEMDHTPILQAIDISKVPHGDTDSERTAYCEAALKKLVSLQEDVVVLQKSAREKGISGGLLTIVGQAASQSPEDNGASVLRQLSDLVQGDSTKGDLVKAEKSEISVSHTAEEKVSSSVAPAAISLDEIAANDLDRHDLERLTGLQLLAHTLSDHWKPLIVDASVCAIAAGIAISLIN